MYIGGGEGGGGGGGGGGVFMCVFVCALHVHGE